MKTFSLAQQIEEVDRELELRKRVYPGLVHKGSMRQSVADFHLERLRAVRASLQWLMINETDVRAFASARAEARKTTELCPDCQGNKGTTALVDGSGYRGPVFLPCKRCEGTGSVKKAQAA